MHGDLAMPESMSTVYTNARQWASGPVMGALLPVQIAARLGKA